MDRTRRLVVGLAVASLLAAGACRRSDPAERVARLRGLYTATLEGFTARQEPATALPADPPSDLLLDLRLRRQGSEELPGLTLEVALLDVDRREKERYRVWVDATGVEAGEGSLRRQALDDVPYQPGDTLRVEVRRDVPPAERGLYREFAGAPGRAASPTSAPAGT